MTRIAADASQRPAMLALQIQSLEISFSIHAPSFQTINRKQLAELAGVSPAVITKVIHDRASTVAVSKATRERVLELARKHHYQPDISGTSLVSGHSFLIGVFFTEEMSHVMWETVKGLEAAAAEKDYAVLSFPVPSSIEEESVRLPPVSFSGNRQTAKNSSFKMSY